MFVYTVTLLLPHLVLENIGTKYYFLNIETDNIRLLFLPRILTRAYFMIFDYYFTIAPCCVGN